MSLRLRSFIPLSIIIAFAFGIEDTAFYALQSTLPTRYIGVEILGVWQPSLATALTFNLLGLILICSFLVTVFSFEKSDNRHRYQLV
jgi:predicted outer membrane lipoprotein